ncbi:MAG: carboxypeptidase regulatory-like domain-containing protein [Candidatus Eisenbacteria bacterium]|nr:carboxypeptidase regulatory-like domain-containing protein [Candidatus Eisenbacteria bacterium]
MSRLWRVVAGVVLAALLSAPSVAMAFPREAAGVVQVDILSREDIHRLNELGMDIMSVRNGVADIAAVPSEVEVLWANGFRPRVLLSDIRDGVASLALEDRGEYHSYAEITAELAAWAAAYPSITQLVSIGTSFQGREIWALKITDNPTVQEDEAEIQWIGCHHGNETISAEVCYYTAEYLLENYGADPQVTWLVNEREIWIIPILNPDGHVAGTRYNAEGTDLNRNYACPCGCNASTAFSAPETQALRDFNVGMNPVTSLTFHSGAVYVNYLWDYSYAATPDEPMIITISNGYGARSGLPVTNGADWYIAHGTCQDWCYDTRGEIDTTIEVSTSYEPPASQIDTIVNSNISAMLYQARMSGKGIRGMVTDGDTGEPLYATISIPEIGKDVHSDPDVGDYHRMVESGTYTVVCNVPGFPTQTVYNVSASLDTFTVVNFQFEVDRGTISGYVTDTHSNPIAATVQLSDMGGYSDVADPATGYYEVVNVPVGDHDVRASLPGYSSDEEYSVHVSDGAVSTVDFELEQALFFDDIESGTSQWSGTWGATSSSAHSPSTSMTDSPGGNYPANATTTMTLQSALDLSESETGTLVFWQKYDTESGYDYCYVEVSTNGGSSWTRLASYSGLLSEWAEVTLDISDYVGTSGFKVRFILDSDGWIQKDGWYVDDVHVFADQPETGVEEGELILDGPAVSNFPNPFNPRTTVRFDVPSRAAVGLRVYDVSGRLVRTLVNAGAHDPGRFSVEWNGTDERGTPVAAGVYFALLSVGDETVSGKMVLLK